jgi:D-arabinose 1-dehydrogenase-like Zn-dependent alcohol dehydrogenase
MQAYRLTQAQTQPEFQDVPEPHAGPGQVVVRVAGSGLCHTDFTVISRERSYWKNEPPPFTLGHEIAGWVEEIGPGVAKFRPGDAVDRSEARLKLAREYGADDVVSSGPDAARQIRELTGGVGAAFVLDCAGVDATLTTAVAALSWRGRLTMVGAGGGSIPFDFFKVPPGAQLVTSLNGGSIALMEVVGMAALGRLKILVDRYPLSAAKQAYDDFEHGRLVGRAVLMPAPSHAPAADGGTTDSSRIAPATAGV